MTSCSMPESDAALRYIAAHFPAWNPAAHQLDIDSLSGEQWQTLMRMLPHEVAGTDTSALRAQHLDDFHFFDVVMHRILGSILASRLPIDALKQAHPSAFFDRNSELESEEQQALLKNGYRVSGHRLSKHQLDAIAQEMADCRFSNRGIFQVNKSGAELLEMGRKTSGSHFSSKNGDTFWLDDQGSLCRKGLFSRLAFDPYILATAARYFGCCPVHVQTNLWFSFPTFQDRNNLSTNAQLFHQDKEFTKFLKVFIYLSDVGLENGPHRYVEGSHIDEAHRHGVAFSERMDDSAVLSHYAAQQIKTLVGPAGTITFGDTSCVHKGEPVLQGCRIMLQLEYAASLYLSPIAPFDDFQHSEILSQMYPPDICRRLTANYTTQGHLAFMQRQARTEAPQVSLARKLLRLGKRYLLPT